MAFKSRPVAVNIANTVLYACPVGTEAAAVISIANVTSAAAKYTMSFFSMNDGVTMVLAQDVTVPPNSVMKYPAPIALEQGDQIFVSAATAGAIRAFATITEGTPGPNTKGLRMRGEYAAVATYDANDVVSLDGSTYVSRTDNNTANNPEFDTANWMPLVLRGEPGPKGDPGEPGEQGEQGPPPVIGSITATTLAPGVAATVDWTGLGTVGSPLAITFGIPQGPAGAGGGNVNTTGAVETNRMAVYADATGTLLKMGPALHAVATSGNASDLTGTLSADRLPASGVSSGSFGASGGNVPNFTVDSKGRITAIQDRALTPANIGAAPAANPSFTGRVSIPASAAGGSGARFGVGTAPSAPVEGDVWPTSAGWFTYYGGAVKQFATVDLVPAKGTGSDLLTGTNDTKYLTSKAIRDAHRFVTINPASINLSTFINGKWTVPGLTTVSAPTGVIEGQSGTIEITSSGNYVTAWNSFWDFGEAGAPTLSTTAGDVDVIHYRVRPGGTSAKCIHEGVI